MAELMERCWLWASMAWAWGSCYSLHHDLSTRFAYGRHDFSQCVIVQRPRATVELKLELELVLLLLLCGTWNASR